MSATTRRDDGGPAFPQPGGSGNPETLKRMRYQGGMTLRDWFAGHAPVSPLWNFTPMMPTPRPLPLPILDGYDLPANSDQLRAWDKESDRQAAIQWPWAWADAILAARSK